jgi:hypothetical protein
LLEARRQDPGAYLGYHKKAGVQVLIGTLLNRPIWTPTHEDWGGEDWIKDCTSRVISVLAVFPPPPPSYDQEEPF